MTIHINQGDIYGIVGYSGAGKSILVRVINLLQVPSAGKITVDDTVFYDYQQVQLTAAQLRQKRKDIGIIVPRMAVAPSAGAGMLEKLPIKLPIGVRTADTINTSFIILLFFVSANLRKK